MQSSALKVKEEVSIEHPGWRDFRPLSVIDIRMNSVAENKLNLKETK